MTTIVGIIAYKSDIDVLIKNIQMFSRQSVIQGDTGVDVEIVILDNDYGRQIQEIRDAIQGHIPDNFAGKITCIGSENIGFGKGHNHIFNYMKQKNEFDYYLCANPDGIPHINMLKEMVTFAQDNNNMGIYEARQFPVGHPKVYDPKTGLTAWCSGCCLMFPKDLFEKLGGFDEFFFMYMEDVDISWRSKLHGYDCFTVPGALFCHFLDEKNRDMASQIKRMFISAYKLACKYKARGLKNYCLKELKQILDETELSKLEQQVIDKKNEYKLFKRTEFMNFESGFYFSPVRW